MTLTLVGSLYLLLGIGTLLFLVGVLSRIGVINKTYAFGAFAFSMIVGFTGLVVFVLESSDPKANLPNMLLAGPLMLLFASGIGFLVSKKPEEITRLRDDDSGQDLIEYALMAGFVAIILGVMLPTVAPYIGEAFNKLCKILGIA